MAITYRGNFDAAVAVVRSIEGSGGRAIAVRADASDAVAVESAVDNAFSTFGRLDILLNNAGTAIPNRFEDASVGEMDRIIDVNVRGVFAAKRAALRRMKDGGRIINTGSSVGERLLTPASAS